MTIEELIFKVATEEKDPAKIKSIEDIAIFMNQYMQGDILTQKVPGRKLFDLCEKFIKTWPEYATLLIAMSMLVGAGKQGTDLSTDELKDTDISELMDTEE